MGLPLLVFALIHFKALCFLSQCLPQTYNVPVSGQQKNAFYKGLFIIVPAYILIFQKPDQRLGRRQTYRFHFFFLLLLFIVVL